MALVSPQIGVVVSKPDGTVIDLSGMTASGPLPVALGAGGGLKTEVFDSAGVEVNWSGITTVFRLLSAAGASQDSNNVKNGAGRIYQICGRNNRASSVFLKLYNKATAPSVGSDTPVATIECVASQPFVYDYPIGLAFSIGIGFGLVTAGADASSASVTAADITALNILYT
jgi:hypothetical protein